MTTRKAGGVALSYLSLCAFWLLLSGKLELQYLLMGALAAGVVTFLTVDLLPWQEDLAQREKVGLRFLWRSGWRLLLYILWLLFNIVKSNLQVAYLVLHPRMPIQPGLLRFKTRLKSDLGHIVLANSITLTPGTITVDLSGGTYLVHALVPEAAGSLLEAKMQSKLETIFGEREEPMPEIRWVRDEGQKS